MAKNSKLGAQQTETMIHQAIIDVFFEQGWDAVTYGEIAKKTGLSRSGIQRVVPSKTAMVDAFQGQVVAFVVDKIGARSRSDFKSAWLNAMIDEKFKHCVRFLFAAPSLDEKGITKARSAVKVLIEHYGHEEMTEVIGMSLLLLVGVETKSDA